MIQSLAIVGAGALGLMYAHALQPILGAGLWFCAQGTRLQALKTSTFDLNGRPCRFAAMAPGESINPPQVVLVAVKNYHLPEVLPLIQALAGPETLIISVLNGISSEDEILQAIPQGRVALCTVQAMDAHKDGLSVSWSRMGTMFTGLMDSSAANAQAIWAQLGQLEALFAQAGIPASPVADIQRRLWSKWMLNIGINQVSAVTGARFGRFTTDPDIKALFVGAMEEVLALAKVMNVELGRGDMEGWFPVIASLDPLGQTSMLQDVEQGRQTEVESFSGKLIALAELVGIDPAVNRVLYHIINSKRPGRNAM